MPAYGQGSRTQREERQAVRGPEEEGHEQEPRSGDRELRGRVEPRRQEVGQLVVEHEEHLEARRDDGAEEGGRPQGRQGHGEEVLASVRRVPAAPLKARPCSPEGCLMDWHTPGLIAPADRTPPTRFVTDVVLELGLASHDDVHAAVEAAKTTGVRAEAVLLDQGILDDERLARALAERYGLDRLELDHFPVDPAAAALVGVDAALRHEALPVAQLDGGRLLVAIADPGAGPGASAVAAATGRDVVPAVAPRHRLRALIEATASRSAVPWAEPPVEDAPPAEPDPAGADDRVAELERELAEAHGRLNAADERVAAATHRMLELEADLERARAMLAAVRDAVGVAA